jgi:hypothetical protein
MVMAVFALTFVSCVLVTFSFRRNNRRYRDLFRCGCFGTGRQGGVCLVFASQKRACQTGEQKTVEKGMGKTHRVNLIK